MKSLNIFFFWFCFTMKNLIGVFLFFLLLMRTWEWKKKTKPKTTQHKNSLLSPKLRNRKCIKSFYQNSCNIVDLSIWIILKIQADRPCLWTEQPNFHSNSLNNWFFVEYFVNKYSENLRFFTTWRMIEYCMYFTNMGSMRRVYHQ